MPRGISLHVGLNSVDPSHYNGWDGTLGACEFDATDMQSIANSRGFESTILLTKSATAAAVQEAIEHAANELGSGDFFFVTYAGHGGQVPDRNDDERRNDKNDTSDETWVLYDRQFVDDELYDLWGKFKAGVRIFVLSDSCHSGTVARDIAAEVPDVVATAERAAAQSPRYRALPRDIMIGTYRQHAATYDAIQKEVPPAETLDVAATLLLVSGCQDDQLSRDGFDHGLFTEKLLGVWNNGSWTGTYARLHEEIVAQMPEDQQPNYYKVGAPNADFEQQQPLTLG